MAAPGRIVDPSNRLYEDSPPPFTPSPEREKRRTSIFSPAHALRRQEHSESSSRDLRLEVCAPTTLRSLETAWQNLADDASEPNPFFEPWALLPALDAFGTGVEVVVVSRAHPSLRKGERELCGLFPVACRQAANTLHTSMISIWRHPYAYLGAPLVRHGLEAEAWSAFFDWLESGGRQRGLIRIEDFPGDGPLRIALIDELYRRGWTHGVTQNYTRAVLKRAYDAESYFERTIPGKRRKEFRRLHQRLAEVGRLVTEELDSLEDCNPWTEEFIALETLGWKGREEVGVKQADNHLRYFRSLIRQASLRGRCMALSLRLDDQPIAMKLNLLSIGGAVAFKITYDERFARYSPGVLLELDNIQRVHERADIPWMDSCAAPNRAMINRLWSDRREMQTLLIATDDLLASAAVSALPLVRWFTRRMHHHRSRARS